MKRIKVFCGNIADLYQPIKNRLSLKDDAKVRNIFHTTKQKTNFFRKKCSFVEQSNTK